MLQDTEILIKEYKKEYDSYLSYLEENDWIDDVFTNINNGKLESTKLDTEKSIISTILTSMTKLKSDIEVDLDKKPVISFFKYASDIVNLHISRINEYKNQNPLDVDSTESDVEFHSDLFSLLTKTKVGLSKIAIGSDNKNSLDLFRNNEKATLVMRPFLYDTIPIVKSRTDDLNINFGGIVNPSTSSEMFINMKPGDIPPWDPTKHYFEQELSTIQFWEEEMNKLRNGININGYHISGWLYWDINFFKLSYIDKETNIKVIKQPEFRDNEYYFDAMCKKARENGRVGLFMYGTRRFGKSKILSSHVLHGLYTIPNCKATIQGFSEVPDLKAINDYIQECISYIHPALKFSSNTLDLNSGVNLGLKSKSGQERYDMSRLSYVNLEGGNTKKGGQKTAGFTPDVFVLDEALSEDSLLWTPEGSITMSDVKVGDSIYGADGNLTKVLDKIDVGVKPLYRLTLRNGNYVDACGDHLWEVKDKLSVKSRIEIKTTDELLSDYMVNGVRSRYSIRKACPIKFPFKEVGIDPYWLGLWLGDGTKRSTCITTIDDEIMDYVEKYSNKLNLLFKKKLLVDKHRKTPTYKVGMVKPNGSPNVIINQLRELNVLRNKHIPDIYKFNSVDVRLSVLQGLIDTDGTVCEKGRVDITLGNKRLFDDTLWLIESLGIATSKVNIRTINGKDYYRVSFNTDLDVCRLSRKKSRRRGSLSKKGISNLKWVSLVDITPIGDKQAYCIKVDNEDKLFVTNNFMVTHNCGKGSMIKPWMAALPSFAGGANGKFRCLPILSGTSGDSALSKDAETILKNPGTYDIMPMDWDLLNEISDPEYITWTPGTTFGMFVPAQLCADGPAKIKKSLNDFLGTSNPKLEDITIYATDWEKTHEFYNDKREVLKNDLAALASNMNSYPLDVADCYLTSEKNIFPGLECKYRKEHIEKEGSIGQPYRLFKDSNGKIRMEMDTWEDVIYEYPYKGGSTDSPVIILEDPTTREGEIPLGLYVMGLDDIKMDVSDGDSIASATIFKRGYEGGEWANRIVAYYDSRPDKKVDYYRQLYLLMKLYNCRVLYENADNGFIEWVESNHPTDVNKHFSQGVGLASEENLHINKNRKYGWSPTGQNIYLLLQKIVMYTKEDNVVIGLLDNCTGVDRINHPMLLEEMYKYKKDNNADRLRSFGLAYTLAKYYDNTYQYMKNRRSLTHSDDDYKAPSTRRTYGGIVYDTRIHKRRG